MKTRTVRRLSAAHWVALAAVAVATTMGQASPAVADPPETAEVALAWQETALTTIPFSPAQSLYLAFTSRAVDKAVRTSLKQQASSETAAVAQAAHDVLAEYFPAASGALDARLATSLDSVPDGEAKARGIAIGADAADEVIASRVGDGRGDSSIVYSADPGPGVWIDSRPMAVAWYGFVDRVNGKRPVAVDGPDPVGSPEYRADLAEVQANGRAGADATKAATATFFNVPAFGLYRNALIGHLRSHPLSLAETADLFGDLDRASAEAMRQTWRLKFTEGFWRPTAAITSQDGDPLTEPVAGWTSVLPVPPYPEYPSGHGTITSAFAQTVRCHLGDIPLTLVGAGGQVRAYGSLADLEHDAFMSRIWGGIHFRDAMDDAFQIGHTVAGQVCG
ncbi:MAG TPA: hypothetical protein VM097_03255 [Mycobacteriales bacterium]|nr:hypothetical protein [Mycobacteriales bacterium]